MSVPGKPAKGVVHLTTRVATSRHALFRACSTTRGLEGWYADVVSGTVAAGETLRLEWPEVGAGMEVRVAEVIPEERVVFEGQGTRVVLELGEQELRLSHEGVPEGTAAGLRSSWKVAMALLAHGLEWHPSGRRQAHWAIRQVDATSALAHVCLTDREAQRSWLGDSSGIGTAGDPFSLVWFDGQRLSGHVLTETPGGDVAVTLEELDRSVLTLRTLPAPKGCYVALCWSTWSQGDRGEIKAQLADALERLSGLLGRRGES